MSRFISVYGCFERRRRVAPFAPLDVVRECVDVADFGRERRLVPEVDPDTTLSNITAEGARLRVEPLQKVLDSLPQL